MTAWLWIVGKKNIELSTNFSKGNPVVRYRRIYEGTSGEVSNLDQQVIDPIHTPESCPSWIGLLKAFRRYWDIPLNHAWHAFPNNH